MSKPIKKRPVIIPPHTKDKTGDLPRVDMVRAQTNNQLLREFYNKRGMIRLRIPIQIATVSGAPCGWNGGAVTVEGGDVEIANQFVERLRKAIIEIGGELGLTVKANAVIS
jgi:hypothetical protein